MAAGRGHVAFRDLRSFAGKHGERVDMPAVALTKRELDPKKSWKAAPVADGSRQPRKRSNADPQEPGEDGEAGRTTRKKKAAVMAPGGDAGEEPSRRLAEDDDIEEDPVVQSFKDGMAKALESDPFAFVTESQSGLPAESGADAAESGADAASVAPPSAPPSADGGEPSTAAAGPPVKAEPPAAPSSSTKEESMVPLCDFRAPLHFDAPRCGRCGMAIEVARVQINTKGGPKYKCSKCNVRAVQISQYNMTEAVQAITRDFTPEQVTEFYRSVNDVDGGIVKLRQFIEESLEAVHKVGKTTTDGGGYQPLKYYGNLGYDTESIEKNCKDVMTHPVLGKVYKVDILKVERYRDEWRARKKEYRKEVPSSSSSDGKKDKKKKKGNNDAKKDKKKKKHGKKDKKKRGKSSSSSSSSSLSPGTKRKNLEKEMKQKKIEAEKASKARAAERKKEIRSAFSVLSKLSHVEDLETQTKDKHWGMVPDWAKQQATELIDKARAAHTNATAVTKDKKDTVKLTVTVDEAATAG